MINAAPDIGFWRTLRILLAASRTRSTGRRKRQQQLMQQRSGKVATTDWGFLGTAFSVLLMVGINVLAAFLLHLAVEPRAPIPPQPQSTRPYTGQNKIAVSQAFLDGVHQALSDHKNFYKPAEDAVDQSLYDGESERIAQQTGRSQEDVQHSLRRALHDQGASGFVLESDSDSATSPAAVQPPADPARLAPMLGSIVLLLWFVMLIFQGEGLELDLQRRRHPMWEWLFSHPVPASAIFMAEMLSPLAANPIYWGAPLFVGILYGFAYDPGLGALAAILIGIPIAIATACVGKALEIAAILRFSPRNRGAIIGIMGWLGYASLMFFFLGFFILPKAITALAKPLLLFTVIPWPYLGWFTGAVPDGSHSFVLGMVTCWALAASITSAAVWFGVWGAQQGLAGNFAADSRPSTSGKPGLQFGNRPLYRKELLWFARDHSAIVQTILIPITVASFQLFNLRGIIAHAQGAWNYLCGAAILFGTYFLWVLGPKSLSSEGSALWIALTWPQGLEVLLKAKAWLWSIISTGAVLLILGYAVFLFPSETWKIALVAVGWFIFSRSMAEKSVTLVTVTSDSGEVTKVPKGRLWAAQLGMLTFSIGIVTQQWHIAIMGIVYSWITAAAMWQNFRAHLPFLYDPWSEELPPPPTLMHAMVAISILVEGGAVVAGIFIAIFGVDNIAIAQAMGYGICSAIVAIGTSSFLEGRGVPLTDVLNWPPGRASAQSTQPLPWLRTLGLEDRKLFPSLLAGVAGGLLLGLFAHGYMAILHHIPAIAEIIHKSEEQMAKTFGLKQSYFVMAVIFAPFAEEYLFRGLLYRALDREWGGWPAILGSAAFFAIYHQPLSWIPVSLLGVTNALLFKKTGRLAPAILLHMVYNAIVLT